MITACRALSEMQERLIARLYAFALGDGRLHDWRQCGYCGLAGAFDPEADVPLREWQQRWPPGRAASVDAFERLLGVELPMRRRQHSIRR